MAVAIDGLQVPNEFLYVVDVIVQMELAVFQRHQAGIFPIGDVNLVITQHGFDRIAQQGRVVTRQRCHDQHGGLIFELGQRCGIVRKTFKSQQFTKRFFDFYPLMNCHIHAIHVYSANTKFGFDVIFSQAVEKIVTSGHPLRQRRLTRQVARIAEQFCCGLRQL